MRFCQVLELCKGDDVNTRALLCVISSVVEVDGFFSMEMNAGSPTLEVRHGDPLLCLFRLDPSLGRTENNVLIIGDLRCTRTASRIQRSKTRRQGNDVNKTDSFIRMTQGLLLIGTSVFFSASANAIVQDITAIFRPDSSKPMDNKFINQTPSSGYCLSNPVECNRLNMFSIRLPLKFESTRPMLPGTEPRSNALFNVPAQWRALTVTNVNTGESEQVEVRIAGIGSNYVLSDTAANLTGASNVIEGHQKLWAQSSWVYAPPPCEYSGVGFYSSRAYAFFWRTPVEGVCLKSTLFPIPAMSYSYLDFAYELRTPNPLGMSSGLYSGTLNYRVGPGGDFDMGDVMVPDDSIVTLNFNLQVEHTLKVEIPPGRSSRDSGCSSGPARP